TDIITVTYSPPDTIPPAVSITTPTTADTYVSSTHYLALGGTATDDSGSVSHVRWSSSTDESGVATGTSVWTIPSVMIIEPEYGPTEIWVTAVDHAGNSSTDTLIVTYSPTDIIAPTVTISSPTSAATYTTTTPVLTLSGMAADNVGVSQVSWSNDRGGSGTASGTFSWTAAGITLQSGTNVITVTGQDGAGNSGTDILTVTYSFDAPPPPPPGAYTVIPSSALNSVVPGQNNIVPLSYLATAGGGGSFTVTSTSGSFVGGNSGRVLGTVNSPVTINILNGTGMPNETLTFAPKIMTAAINSGENRIIYRRTFSDGVNTVVSEVTQQVVPILAGPFSFTRLALRFEGAASPGRITIERNTLCPKVFAGLSYNGSGFLRGQWLVDGQILGFVNQQLFPGIEMVTLESPRVPPFPTYDTGRHEVTFEILDPEPGFIEPIVHYYVIEGEGGGLIDSFRLLSPAEGASVAMAVDGPYPEFKCQTLAGNHSYHFELFPAGPGAEQVPLVKAISKSGTYQLSQMDVKRLSHNLPYRWQVKVYDRDFLVAASVFRNVYFVAPSGDGEIELRNLKIVPILQESFLHRLLTPNSAFAADLPPTDRTTTFSVPAGNTILMSSDLVNDTAISKSHLRVEFVVNGEVVDASFVQRLLPGETITVEGTYEVLDAKPHNLEI
ncbi:MAG: hypothetical protein KAG12_04565, partial [Desulfuromusa sp.]|nr:hypothetical protein [Desulfuromusa sp.]